MSQPYQPPRRRLATNRRIFEHVVRDMNYAVFSVVRNRPLGNNQWVAHSLGSGFFVAPEVFLSANHVFNGPALPHQDGDFYHLVRVDRPRATVHLVSNVVSGGSLHLFPESDMALLQVQGIRDQAFVALDYAEWPIGKEIGVAGYPIPRLGTSNGQLTYDGLIFRVAKGVVTSAYKSNIQIEGGHVLPNVPVLEVNFLFVPGNSGGPIFDSETGRVAGFVHGFSTTKIRERVEQVGPNLAPNLPAGLSTSYIENLNALYSLAVSIGHCREHLATLGVNL